MCVVKFHQDSYTKNYFNYAYPVPNRDPSPCTQAMGIGKYDAKVSRNYLSQGRLLARRVLKKAVQQGRRRVEAGGVPSGVR